MENKNLKKSTMDQLKTLVYYMEERPEFAKGIPVFGASKFSADEEWKNLAKKINSVSPPIRTVAEWKKTWADLKSRTKKKIAENQKSLRETGGGLYRFCHLTELEQVIDRTLCLSSAAAPSGKVFGVEGRNIAPQTIEDCFQPLVETPPRATKVVAVVTPNRQQQQTTQNQTEQKSQQPIDEQLPHNKTAQQKGPVKRSQAFQGDSDDEQPTCSSAKKKRSNADEQLSLIRRQLRVAEQNAATAKEQVDAAKRLADAAEAQAASFKRIADAAEAQQACMMLLQQTTSRIEKVLQNYLVKP